jgi:hypothetical protein
MNVRGRLALFSLVLGGFSLICLAANLCRRLLSRRYRPTTSGVKISC